MILSTLALAAATSFAAPAAAPQRPPEETLRVMLSGIRRKHDNEKRESILGSGENLRDAVTSSQGSAKKQMADRLPGMSRDPFNLCRDLARCPDAPLSLHVEDDSLIDDAFMALARPWFNLQKARGKDVAVKVEPGLGVQLTLSELPGACVVTLESSPAPTGGFDVSLRETDAAAVYARERADLLAKK